MDDVIEEGLVFAAIISINFSFIHNGISLSSINIYIIFKLKMLEFSNF